jgi:putative glycosyltransferase (TIGR04372 family)
MNINRENLLAIKKLFNKKIYIIKLFVKLFLAEILLTLFPENLNIQTFYTKNHYHRMKLYPQFYGNRFRKSFHRVAIRNKRIYLNWGTKVSFSYLVEHDMENLYRFMKESYYIKDKLIKETNLDLLGIAISSDNMFSNYNVHGYLDTHIKAKILGIGPDKKIIQCLKKEDFIANPVMKHYWNKYIDYIENDESIAKLEPLKEFLKEDLAFQITLNETPVYIEHAKSVVQKEWEKRNNKPLFELSEEDKDFGWSQLAKYGIKRGSRFVSLHVRDSGYKSGSHLVKDPYDEYRNADVSTYQLAIDSLIDKGTWVIRVGDPNMKPIKEQDRVLDYAKSTIRSNRMDIFLFSQCFYFVGVSSGPVLNPILFGVPVVMTNFIPLSARPHASNCLFIPKLLFSNKLSRILTFEEILGSNLGSIYTAHGYESEGIQIIDNTDEEIKDVVNEMYLQCTSSVSYTNEDNLLQNKVKKLYDQYSRYGSLGRMGNSFINKYNKQGLI